MQLVIDIFSPSLTWLFLEGVEESTFYNSAFSYFHRTLILKGDCVSLPVCALTGKERRPLTFELVNAEDIIESNNFCVPDIRVGLWSAIKESTSS